MWRHPKYYKELRKLRNKSDQAISDSVDPASGVDSVRPGPGLQQVIEETVPHNDIEEASSAKLSKQQAASVKPRGTSIKLQATSVKLHDS